MFRDFMKRDCVANKKPLPVSPIAVEPGRIRVRALRTEQVEGLMRGSEDRDKAFSGPSIEASWLQGDLAAGEVSGLVTHIPTVKELIDEMVKG